MRGGGANTYNYVFCVDARFPVMHSNAGVVITPAAIKDLNILCDQVCTNKNPVVFLVDGDQNTLRVCYCLG